MTTLWFACHSSSNKQFHSFWILKYYATSSYPSSIVTSVNNIFLNIGVANSWYTSIMSQNSPLLTQLLPSVTGFKHIMGTLLSVVSWRKNTVSDFFKVWKHYQQCFPFWKTLFVSIKFTHLLVVTYYSTSIMTHVLHWHCVNFVITLVTEIPHESVNNINPCCFV